LEIDVPVDLRQRVSWSIVLAIALVPLGMLEVRPMKLKGLDKVTSQNLALELAVVVGALVVLGGILLYVHQRYVFFLGPSDFPVFGISGFLDYVKRGVVELLLVLGTSYVLAGVSTTVIDRAKKGGSLLRYLILFLLLEAIVFAASVWRRLFVLELEYGLTRERVYGMILLLTLVVLSLVMVGRYVKKIYVGWLVVELVAVVLFVVGAMLIDVDRMVVRVMPPKSEGKIDYEYLTGLSADGLAGWVLSYEYARKVVENYSSDSEAMVDEDIGIWPESMARLRISECYRMWDLSRSLITI
jgi:hypothetical protein